MLSHSGYSINTELYIFYKILIYSSFKSGIQYLFLKRSLFFLLRKYFVIAQPFSLFEVILVNEKLDWASNSTKHNTVKALKEFCSIKHK